MQRRAPLLSVVVFVGWTSVAAAPTTTRLALQDPASAGKASEQRPAEPAALAEPPLAAEDRVTLARIRSSIETQDLDDARERLHAAVAALAAPLPGAEAARIAFLLELDRAAEDLESLPELLSLREALLELRARLLPKDHPDVLEAKRSLAATRFKLGDQAGARALLVEVVDARTRVLPKDDPDLLYAKYDLAGVTAELGDVGRARELLRELVASLSDPAAGEENASIGFRLRLIGLAQGLESREESLVLGNSLVELVAAKKSIALTRHEQGDLAGARKLFEEVLAVRARLFRRGHPDLLAALTDVAIARYEVGDLPGAREPLRDVVTMLSESFARGAAMNVTPLLELDGLAQQLGCLKESLVLRELALESCKRLHPEDHPDLLAARQRLAATKAGVGDLAGAQELYEQVLAARARLLPGDHPDLLRAKLGLAATKLKRGDLDGALQLGNEVLAAQTRMLPGEHRDLLDTKELLALTRYKLGELVDAYAALEEVLAAQTRALPGEHPDLLQTKLNLAGLKVDLGDLAGARTLLEEVMDVSRRLFPADHPIVLTTKQNLALTMLSLGDRIGARELLEEVLAVRSRLLPSDHPQLLEAKGNLALARIELDDFQGALELNEEVLAAGKRLLPEDHPDLLKAQVNLVTTKGLLGDLDLADALKLAEVFEVRARLLPEDHPDLLETALNLAQVRSALGDLAGACEMEELVLEARTRLLPPDHPALIRLRRNLAETKSALGDHGAAHALVASMLDGQRMRARALHADAPRIAREGARQEIERLSGVLALDAADPEHPLAREIFATLESLRLASVASSEAALALGSHPELQELAAHAADQRARLTALAAGPPQPSGVERVSDEDIDRWRKSLLELAEGRDRAERELRTKLAAAGAFVGDIEASALGARLARGTAAVSFFRYAKEIDHDAAANDPEESVDSLLAFVVLPGGAVSRVELGPAAELEALVRDWRRTLGKPIERGIELEQPTRESEAEAGRALRMRLLGPVLAVTGEATKTLHVVLDDLLFLVPLDALPLEGDVRVGERLAIRVEPTFARLLREKRPAPAGGTLVALGGVDFDVATVVVEGSAGGVRQADAPPATWVTAAAPPTGRSGSRAQFVPLRQTRYEVDDVLEQYREALGRDPVRLSGADATKRALFDAAPRARYLHLATHGYFASESFRSQLDDEGGARERWLRAEEALHGLAPESLCGLALAGANRGQDAVGRVPGILTAEELASIDLRGCELAVLSACETNVGIRRAGQGIQSLQTALHAAGARTAITSLWKVDDAATRRLFELFYTKLWKEKLGKADALWQAKMALRAAGHPPRDWAGWVLSGDPD